MTSLLVSWGLPFLEVVNAVDVILKIAAPTDQVYYLSLIHI